MSFSTVRLAKDLEKHGPLSEEPMNYGILVRRSSSAHTAIDCSQEGDQIRRNFAQFSYA